MSFARAERNLKEEVTILLSSMEIGKHQFLPILITYDIECTFMEEMTLEKDH